MRLALILGSALCLCAADIAVRRQGPAFVVSGVENPANIEVFVGEGDVPPVIGTVTNDGETLVFRPRYDISPTLPVRVRAGGKEFRFPAEQAATPPAPATTRVENVYPTAAAIPANQLKFYIHFSAAMRPGEAWQHLQLLDSKGKPVELAFLEIDQELWDRDNRRLTVLFDPGRIKRGVTPRDEVGAALEPGATYTLAIDPAWRDAQGAPLAAGFRRKFLILPEDRTPIDPARWQLRAPRAGTREPLTVDFGEPLDAALALRLLSIQNVNGDAVLGAEERTWAFTPSAPWPAGGQVLVVDTALEDLAGNKVGRPFDVDTFERVTVRASRGSVTVPFRAVGPD